MPEAIDSLLATPTISTRLPVRKPMCLSLFWLFGSAGRHEGGFQQLLCIRMLRCREYLGSRPCSTTWPCLTTIIWWLSALTTARSWLMNR